MLRILALTAFLTLPFAAEARLSFGTQDKLETVGAVNLTGPNGVPLELARRVSTKSFLAPYYVSDEGFVLIKKGKTDSYFPMPTGAELVALQQEGLIPNPLPKWEMPMEDKIFGYLLWEILLAMAAWGLIKKAFGKKSEA